MGQSRTDNTEKLATLGHTNHRTKTSKAHTAKTKENKTQHRKLKDEQHGPHRKPGGRIYVLCVYLIGY